MLCPSFSGCAGTYLKLDWCISPAFWFLMIALVKSSCYHCIFPCQFYCTYFYHFNRQMKKLKLSSSIRCIPAKSIPTGSSSQFTQFLDYIKHNWRMERLIELYFPIKALPVSVGLSTKQVLSFHLPSPDTPYQRHLQTVGLVLVTFWC